MKDPLHSRTSAAGQFLPCASRARRRKSSCAAGHEVRLPRPLRGSVRSHPARRAKSPRARRSTPSSPAIAANWPRPTAIVVVHPNWWGQPPAILKGWIDRVFRQGVVYEFAPAGRGRSVGGQVGGRADHVEHAARRRVAVVRRSAGEPLEDLRLRLLRRRRLSSPQLRVDRHEHAAAAPAWLDAAAELIRRRFPPG